MRVFVNGDCISAITFMKWVINGGCLLGETNAVRISSGSDELLGLRQISGQSVLNVAKSVGRPQRIRYANSQNSFR